ncbi:LuxR C-terminal-related transcriptional regulator [Streptomyces sp. NPDC057623]|uniref:LuxR C-terminal-related transcriptional regulator n=1 Tax=Streptomyces sp. NPDC057623 TaxID=3346187 RepID=UPI0036AC76B6
MIVRSGIGLSDEIDEIHSRMSALSAREFEVLRLVATGMTNYSIGMELGISERTAREHIARIMLKLRVSSRVEIAVIATKWDLFNLVHRGQSSVSDELSPEEIERVLATHPDVADVQVLPVPDTAQAQAQVPVARVVLRQGCAQESLVRWCRERMALHQVPRRFESVREIPRSATDKPHARTDTGPLATVREEG